MENPGRKYRIAIDGHSSSGKSTIAKSLAALLGYKYIDTGAMYRAITYKLLCNNINITDIKTVKSTLKKTTIDFSGNENHVILDGINLGEDIRSLRVSEMVSEVAAIPEVREFLFDKQKELAANEGVVMDGRDIGTVIMPDADFKFFITASLKVRAERRQKELAIKSDNNIEFDQVIKNLEKRDEIDSSRLHSPLKLAENAVIIDTSDLTMEEQLKQIKEIIDNTKVE
ncbi:MAG: (d)CMP kinase [Deltaproteobacteria bacterium]